MIINMRMFLVILAGILSWGTTNAQIRVLANENVVKVAVIDTGFDYKYANLVPLCKSLHKDFTGEGLVDTHGHGTNIVGLITQNAKTSGYCIIIIKAYGFKTGITKQYLKEALDYADMIGANVVNISSGGIGPVDGERTSIKNMLKEKRVVVAASGNDNLNLDKDCNYYPACYDNRIFVVGNIGTASNYGKIVDIKLNGNKKSAFGRTFSGSSQSTAIFTGLMLNLALSKHKK